MAVETMFPYNFNPFIFVNNLKGQIPYRNMRNGRKLLRGFLAKKPNATDIVYCVIR